MSQFRATRAQGLKAFCRALPIYFHAQTLHFHSDSRVTSGNRLSSGSAGYRFCDSPANWESWGVCRSLPKKVRWSWNANLKTLRGNLNRFLCRRTANPPRTGRRPKSVARRRPPRPCGLDTSTVVSNSFAPADLIRSTRKGSRQRPAGAVNGAWCLSDSGCPLNSRLSVSR